MKDRVSPEARQAAGPAALEDDASVVLVAEAVEEVEVEVEGLLETVSVVVTVATGLRVPVVALELPQAAKPSATTTGSTRRRIHMCRCSGWASPDPSRGCFLAGGEGWTESERARICMWMFYCPRAPSVPVAASRSTGSSSPAAPAGMRSSAMTRRRPATTR